MLFLYYPGCISCRHAKQWLDERGIAYTPRLIREEPPTAEELRAWRDATGLPLKRFFNTSGKRYAALGLKDRLPEMTEDEQLALLAGDGMLVKRPLVIDGARVLIGFKTAEWAEFFAPEPQ